VNFDADFDAFCEALDDLWSIKGQALTAGAKGAFFRALEDQPLQVVQAALIAHSRDPERGRFLPMPADVMAQIRQLDRDDGRPGAEEAWAMSLRSADEAETVVWTGEMAEAWTIAKPVLQAGDEVGARMAFREAYARLVEAARQQRTPVTWSASLGFDPQRRELAISAAVTAGRLPASELQALPAPEVDVLRLAYEQPAQGASLTELQARERLRQLSERLKARKDEPSEDALARAFTEERKAETAELVSQYVESRQPEREVHA
jgi:hypothetical protein